MRRVALAIVLTAATLHAQTIRYEVPEKAWNRDLGTHRAVVKVDAPAEAVRAHLEWRRRDPQPQRHGVVITDSTGKRVENALAPIVTNDSGDVAFEAAIAGEYFVYFLPGNPGGGSFPSAKYLGPQDTAAAEWKAKAAGWKALPEAKPLRWEARTAHDRFNEMEIIATQAEREAWLAAHPGDVHIFLESRERPVRMLDQMPELWLKRDKAPELTARPGEVFMFQVCVWAARTEVEIRALRGEVNGLGAVKNSSELPIEPLAGVGSKAVTVRKGAVHPVWCRIEIPLDAKPGGYTGSVLVHCDAGTPTPLAIRITGDPLADGGDSEPWKHTKLAWLDSRIAEDGAVPKPFTPVRIEGKTLHFLGRSVTLGDDGLPERITSHFDPGVTRIGKASREILSAPMRFVCEAAAGASDELHAAEIEIEPADGGGAKWFARSSSDKLRIDVSGSLEPDGYLAFACFASGVQGRIERSIRLEIPRTADTCKYSIGLGYYGGAARLPVDCKWDVKNHQDALWLGDVNAGLRVRLRAENYVRPMVNIHYPRQPLNDPPSWSGGGNGGITVKQTGESTVLFTAWSGARTLEPGKPLHFDFDLSVTPFKPLETEAQWRDRYYHVGGMPAEPEKVRAMGASIVNIHQGNALNPYINYPFLTADKLRDYTDRAHAAGLRVKFYYTIRELTNWAPELFALRSFGSELLAPGRGGGHAWCEEHLAGNYWGAWFEPGSNDASVLTATKSRFDNLYLEGLRWLIENAGCDGIYLDDISYDRTVMKRARVILDRYAKRGGLIDLHSWNELNGMAGHASCALIFMDSLPYVDRLWLGEGHHYDGPPEQTLVAISGVPFGLMGEMLEGGGNPWLGLTFGMTGRLGWGGSPQPVWKLWDEFGVKGSEFIGWWDSSSPVKATASECRATIWRQNGRTLVAVGNFSGKPVRTTLAVDFSALGLDPKKAHLYAPEMNGFQPELLFAPDAAISIAPKRGFAFILDETPRQPVKPATTLVLNQAKVTFEDAFVPAPRDGWKIVASKKAVSVKPEEGGLVFYAPANAHAWAERALPPDAAVVAAQIRQDTGDEAQQWGPGVALVWPDGRILKAGRRKDGRFGVSVAGRESLPGMCDAERPVIIAFLLVNDAIRVVATGEGVYLQDQELACVPRAEFPGVPSSVRVGKMPNSGAAQDFGEPGELGWSRCDWLRVYQE